MEVTYRGSSYSSYDEYSGEVIIPETVTYNGITYSVTSIGDKAFYKCSSLTSVTIPESVKSIGNYAFSNCSALTSITIPNSVTSIGNYAFAYCSGLTSITIPNSVTSIGYSAFSNCSALTSITIPNSVTSIGSSAFYGCSGLTSVTIPESVTSIGGYAFYGCSGLTSVTIPESVTSIGSMAFNGCSSLPIENNLRYADTYLVGAVDKTLSTYSIKEGTKWIGDNAFSYCSSLTSITIPESVTSIGYNAFSVCSALTSITIPNSVTSIGDEAFRDCSSLTSATIGNSVTSIGYGAFERCSSLASITIPESVKSIGSFYNCSSLTTVVWNAIICDHSNDGYIFANCPITSITFGENVKIIPNYICNGLNLLTSVTIPESVTSIGSWVFSDCSALTSVSIGNSVTSIGDYAFYGCSALTSVTIPESVTSIGYSAFTDCSALTKTNYTGDIAGWCDIKFGSSDSNPISYSHNLYINGQEIKDLVIPNTVNTIRNYAFSYCSSLTSITIPESVTSIGGAAFFGCSALTSVTIPNSVTSIGGYAFYNCSSLTSATIGNSVTSIGGYAFNNCSSLTSIIIPNSVTSIGNSAFAYCSALTSVSIGNSVTSIGDYAFSVCSALTSITCEATTPPTLGSFTFYSTSIPVYVPCGCVSAYKAAKYWMDFTNIQEPQVEYSIKVSTSNSQMGTAKVDYNTYCDGNQISATANYGYHFVQWSDGVTDNPRTLTLTQDTVLTAEFALTTAGQCGKNLYWVYDTNKSTLTITGSGDMYNERPWGLFANDLTEVALPEGLTHIGNDAFTNCNNLKAITIPASVTSIGANSFAGCRRIRDVYCYPLMPPYAEATSFANYNANLNVPCDFLEDYQYDPVFGSFKYFNCMGAESDNTGSDEVVVTPGTTDVTIVWPTEEDADTYSIVIYKDGRVFCTLTFNANGQLLNIAFAPGRDGNRTVQYTEQVANGYRFTVTGLTESTKYEYNITTKDESDNTISTHTGEFTTKSNTPTDLENNDIQYPISDTRKLLRDGQLYIYHNGSTYTIMGAEIQ